jgi:ribonuclease VapC
VSEVVLDASALLTVLRQEAGAERVEPLLAAAVVGAVNLSEVHAKLIDAGMPAATARETTDLLALRVVPFDADMAWRAAALRPATRKLGLSLGDRACLALGLALRLPVITADRTWTKLSLEVEIRSVR